MADRKISDLTALTTPASGDYLPIVDISEASAANKNKRITIEELLRGAPDGTAGAPGIAFESDPNTGIYSPGADQVAISTNGTAKLSINSTGLHTITAGNNSTAIQIRDASNYAGELVTATDGTFQINARTNTTFTQTGSKTESLRITSAGLVGIGTSSPWSRLSVNMDANNMRFGTAIDAGGNPAIDLYRWQGTGTNYKSARIVCLTDGSIGILSATANSTDFSAQSFTERARIDSSGRLLVGTSSARSNLFNTALISPQVQIEGTTANTSSLSLIRNQSGSGPLLVLAASGGSTVGSNTAVASNYNCGVLSFQGSDGSEFVEAASITCEVDGTPGANDMPGRLIFSTTSDASASPTERMRITSAGNVAINSGTGAGLVAPQTGFSVIGGADVNSATPGIITLGSNDNAVSANDVLGRIRFHSNDASTSMAGTVARIECIATSGFSGTAPTALAFFTNNGVADAETEKMRIKANGTINFSNVSVYADNTAALAGGLVAGDVYRKSDGTLMITY